MGPLGPGSSTMTCCSRNYAISCPRLALKPLRVRRAAGWQSQRGRCESRNCSTRASSICSADTWHFVIQWTKCDQARRAVSELPSAYRPRSSNAWNAPTYEDSGPSSSHALAIGCIERIKSMVISSCEITIHAPTANLCPVQRHRLLAIHQGDHSLWRVQTGQLSITACCA